MNINAERTAQRTRRIGDILNLIKECFAEGKYVDYDRLLNETCFAQQVTRRTAKEYIDIALSQVEYSFDYISSRKCIVAKKESPPSIVNEDSAHVD